MSNEHEIAVDIHNPSVLALPVGFIDEPRLQRVDDILLSLGHRRSIDTFNQTAIRGQSSLRPAVPGPIIYHPHAVRRHPKGQMICLMICAAYASCDPLEGIVRVRFKMEAIPTA